MYNHLPRIKVQKSHENWLAIVKWSYTLIRLLIWRGCFTLNEILGIKFRLVENLFVPNVLTFAGGNNKSIKIIGVKVHVMGMLPRKVSIWLQADSLAINAL